MFVRYVVSATLPMFGFWLAVTVMHVGSVDTRRGGGTGFEWLDSRSAFESARWRHARAWWGMALTGRRRRLTLPVLQQSSYGPIVRHPVGEQNVALAEIVGSVDGGRHRFDRHFEPTSDDAWPRFRSVSAARSGDGSLPPVMLYRARDGYYVLDGHHRVAVAHAFGEKSIRAEVTLLGDAGDTFRIPDKTQESE